MERSEQNEVEGAIGGREQSDRPKRPTKLLSLHRTLQTLDPHKDWLVADVWDGRERVFLLNTTITEVHLLFDERVYVGTIMKGSFVENIFKVEGVWNISDLREALSDFAEPSYHPDWSSFVIRR